MIEELERTEVSEEAPQEMQVSFVPTEYAIALWPKIRQYIANATKYTYGRYEPEDVLTLITDHNHLLWAAFKGEDVYGVVVTSFINYPRATYLSCPFVTGKDFKEWKYPMFRMLQGWARENNCEGLESTARIGWERVFKDDGYQALWQTFQLPLD